MILNTGYQGTPGYQVVDENWAGRPSAAEESTISRAPCMRVSSF